MIRIKTEKVKKEKSIKQDSISYNILMLLGEVGEISFSSLCFYFYETNPKVISNKVKDLEKNKYINIAGKEKNKIKTIRLTKPTGLNWLKSTDEDLYSHYMMMTNKHSFSATTKSSLASQNLIRRHRIAETIVFMKNAGVSTIMNKDLSLDESNRTNYLDNNFPTFYTSVELKNIDKNQRHKTEFTKFIGCLFYKNNAYMIYNIGSGTSNLNEQGEHKAKTLVTDLIANNSSVKNWNLASIILTYSPDDAFKSIKESENKKSEFLSFFNIYSNIYNLTIDNNGVQMLIPFFQEAAHSVMKLETFGEKMLLDSEKKKDCDCDIVDGQKRVLSFLTGNIARVLRFSSFALSQQKTEKSFEILCYDFQKSALVDFCPKNINVLAM